MSATLRLLLNDYHCLLGDGLAAVLRWPTGSMVPDQPGKERRYWSKPDRYYPEEKLVQVVNSRFPPDRPLEHGQGSGWRGLAPSGQT